MGFIKKIKNGYTSIPLVIRRFFLKAIVLFVVWKVLYHTLLLPSRFPDAPLTHITASVSAWAIRLFTSTPVAVLQDVHMKDTLFINGHKVIGIADACNGLELYVLFIGYLICRTGTLKTRLQYGLAGVAIIFVANIIRVAILSWLFAKQYAYTQFLHKYVFTFVLYGIIYLLWNSYNTKNRAIELNAASNKYE
jgi:exosortase family protein XrtF